MGTSEGLRRLTEEYETMVRQSARDIEESTTFFVEARIGSENYRNNPARKPCRVLWNDENHAADELILDFAHQIAVDHPANDLEPVNEEWLTVVGFKRTWEKGFWELQSVTLKEGERLDVGRNTNSDDPRISWSLSCVSVEGWHFQGFVQTRRTVRLLCQAMGYPLEGFL